MEEEMFLGLRKKSSGNLKKNLDSLFKNYGDIIRLDSTRSYAKVDGVMFV